MNSKNLVNASILIVGLIALVLLTKFGCNTNSKELSVASTDIHTEDDMHDHSENSDTSASSKNLNFPSSSFDKEIDLALANVKEGEAAKDQNLIMNEGIMKILAISRQDSNNVRANYYLALFAIQSGQFEKAEKRLEKLILLQPEIQEYRRLLADLQQNKK